MPFVVGPSTIVQLLAIAQAVEFGIVIVDRRQLLLEIIGTIHYGIAFGSRDGGAGKQA